MVEITPTILTNSEAKYSELFKKYLDFGFEDVDIDIAEIGFVDNDTISLDAALAVSNSMTEDDYASIGWDLMVAEPQPMVEQILEFATGHKSIFRIYVHTKSNWKFLSDLDCHKLNIGIAIDGDEPLRNLEFYEPYPEVRFMTIISGGQRRKFLPEVLDKLNNLREMGYTGGITIDGGVNLKSAELINAYAKEIHIDRVSVGSYFQESQDLDLDYKKLKLALNL